MMMMITLAAGIDYFNETLILFLNIGKLTYKYRNLFNRHNVFKLCAVATCFVRVNEQSSKRYVHPVVSPVQL